MNLEQLAILIAVGARRGYVLYDEIDRLLPSDYSGGAELDEILTQLATANIDVRESPDQPVGADPVEYDHGMEDPVNIYVREVCKVPRVAREQEVELARRGAKKDLIEANLHLVIPIARRYADSSHHILDLIQAGNTGLMKAANEFDPDRNYAFSIYAVWHIRRALRNVPTPSPLFYPHLVHGRQQIQ